MLRVLTVMTAVFAGGAVVAQDKPNALQQLMLFRSAVQDHPECAVTVQGGAPVFDAAVAGSAAATCPDAFAWVQFATAIKGAFWTWSMDQTIWVAEPWPMCTADGAGDCCDPAAAVDPAAPPNAHCPTFRADYTPVPPLPATPNGTPSQVFLHDHGALVQADDIDPGRLLRDLELELVFRNRAMFDHIYASDLYTREGLAARNRAQNAAISSGDLGAAQRLQVRFPVDAVMVKADFVHMEVLQAMGLIPMTGEGDLPPNDPDTPFLTVEITGDEGGRVPGTYYLMAMTNASKALPVWHWYAMEHVLNPGRCDYIGCNDSFGYAVPGTGQAGADFGTHYIPPMMQVNNDRAATPSSRNDPLFVTGQTYAPGDTGEVITDALAALLQGMGVGTAATDPDWRLISADDPAWMHYRLKGTQSGFVTPAGVPTGTGNTLTEGGFVNSASCTTCHSQSSVDAQGFAGVQGVGATWRPNLLGYGQVAMGAPNPDWFYDFGGVSVTATQIDFVWGILGASCVAPGAKRGDACTDYYDAPRGTR